MNKMVDTIDGLREISIPPLSRNKEEVILPKLGVNGIGSHRVILDVIYPKDISNIVDALNGHQALNPADHINDRE
jgi:hypothetical protein